MGYKVGVCCTTRLQCYIQPHQVLGTSIRILFQFTLSITLRSSLNCSPLQNCIKTRHFSFCWAVHSQFCKSSWLKDSLSDSALCPCCEALLTILKGQTPERWTSQKVQKSGQDAPCPLAATALPSPATDRTIAGTLLTPISFHRTDNHTTTIPPSLGTFCSPLCSGSPLPPANRRTRVLGAN